MLTSIRTSNEKIEIINQLLLPHTTEYVEITSIEEAHDAIRDMKVRINTFLLIRFGLLMNHRFAVPQPSHHWHR